VTSFMANSAGPGRFSVGCRDVNDIIPLSPESLSNLKRGHENVNCRKEYLPNVQEFSGHAPDASSRKWIMIRGGIRGLSGVLPALYLLCPFPPGSGLFLSARDSKNILDIANKRVSNGASALTQPLHVCHRGRHATPGTASIINEGVRRTA
jgi:hypothetical protein